MKRTVSLLVVFLAVVGACATGPESESTTSTTLGGAATPDAALSALFQALGEGNYAETALLTFDDQLSVLVSLEGFETAATASMLAEGLPASVRENFWESFAEGFPVFSQEDLSGVLIGSGEEFSVEGQSFATVKVALRESEGSGDWIARKDGQGRWRLDLFATFGPSFASPLRGWLAGLEPGPDADVVRGALAAQRASLLAAIQQQPFGPIGPETISEVDRLLFESGL